MGVRYGHARSSQESSGGVSIRVAKSVWALVRWVTKERGRALAGYGGAETLDALSGEKGGFVAVGKAIAGLHVGELAQHCLLHRQLEWVSVVVEHSSSEEEAKDASVSRSCLRTIVAGLTL